MLWIKDVYIRSVRFISGGNWSDKRKPLTCHKSLTNFITCCIIIIIIFIFQSRSPRGAFTFNSHDCLTYIKQHMTEKSVHIKD